MFWLGACIYLFGWLEYMLFCSGEIQPWAMDPEDELQIEISETGQPEEGKAEAEKYGTDNVGALEKNVYKIAEEPKAEKCGTENLGFSEE